MPKRLKEQNPEVNDDLKNPKWFNKLGFFLILVFKDTES